MYNKNWYKTLKRSKLSPPDYVFGIVWPILYTTLAVSFYLIKKENQCHKWCEPLNFFSIQMFFNLIWTWLFFKQKKIKLALLDIALVIIFTILTMIKFFK